MPQLIDSHCHLQLIPDCDVQTSDLEWFTVIDEVVLQAQKEGIARVLCVSINLEELAILQKIKDSYGSFVSLSVGIHPNEPFTVGEISSEILSDLVNKMDAVAVGETGLDYYRGKKQCAQQKRRFIAHIEAAKLSKRPLIIHVRDAMQDTLDILKSEHAETVGGVLHCFTGKKEDAKKALDLGFYISFSGILTFKNANQLQEVVKTIPTDRILIETDSPYLAPVPYRGTRNTPAYLVYVAKQLAQLLGKSLEDITKITEENFNKLFMGSV